MDVESMQRILHEKPAPRTPKSRPKPCMRCQYGVMDIPTDGKMNCFTEGQSNIKTLTKEEVEEMVFCDKMSSWTKMDIPEVQTE
jgi:endo-1,4-beta-mannosidase